MSNILPLSTPREIIDQEASTTFPKISFNFDPLVQLTEFQHYNFFGGFDQHNFIKKNQKQ